MSLDKSKPAIRRVWALMFERLVPQDFSDPRSSTAFDSLDLRSTFFEQYLLQDVRSAAGPEELLGSRDAVNEFKGRLTECGRSTTWFQIDASDSCAGTDATWLSPQLIVQRSMSNASVSEIGLRWQHDADVRKALESEFVWIHAIPGAAGGAGQILELVQKLRTAAVLDPNQPPILIVSVMQGTKREIAVPFRSGLAESLVHVPLWIDTALPEACRIQALTGSFDLLPTAAEFLDVKVAPCGREEDTGRVSMPGEAQLRCDAMSLVSLCNAPRDMPDRIVRLTGDEWTAVRTQEFLLVRSTRSRGPDEVSAFPDAEAPRLYLKPDDFWNVNDVAGTYAEVTEVLGRA